MHKFWKTAVVGAALAALGAANAAVITFDGLEESASTPFMPQLTHGDKFQQSGFWMSPFSNSAFAQAGDLAGAIVDGNDVANTCFNLACPSNNASMFFTALDAGALALGTMSGSAFSLKGFDASFVGSDDKVFPSTTLRLHVEGSKVGGGTSVATFDLPGQTDGKFSFASYLSNGAFASQQFTRISFFGLACDAVGNCSGAMPNKGQFALDNITVSAVPEPSVWLLMGLGLAAVGTITRRRHSSSNAA